MNNRHIINDNVKSPFLDDPVLGFRKNREQTSGFLKADRKT